MIKKELDFQQVYKKFIRRYMLTFLVLVLFFLAKQIIIQYEIDRESNTATIINVAGRQRMLSQRMAKDILHIKENNNEVEREYYLNELNESYLVWKNSHYDLKNDKLTKGIQHSNGAVVNQMFDDLEPIFLNYSEQIEEILKVINENQVLTHARVSKMNEAEASYLEKMDKIVSRYNEEADVAVVYIKTTHIILFIFIVVLLFSIGFFVLSPILKTLKETFLEVNENNENIVKLLQSMKGANFLIRRDGSILIMNEDAEKIIYFDKLQLGQFSVFKNVNWLTFDIEETIEKIQDGIRLEDIETQIEDKDGNILSVLVSAVLGKYKGEDAILLTLFDITNQKNIELALKNIAIKDELTGLYNRHFLDNIIDEEINRSERYEVPLSALLLDLDYFKKVNDQWGHPVGDSVLKFTADILLKEIRTSDYAIRIGGEEFLVLMPHTNVAGGVVVAEKLRKVIETSIHPTIGKFTASFGVAQRNPGDTYRMLYNKVDSALYEAKTAGRNRVVSAPDQDANTSVIFKWNRNWNCKEEKINEQHRKLFVMTSQLAENSFLLEDREKVIKILDEILLHITKHFEYEENALERAGYEYVKNHKKIHNDLALKANEIVKKVKDGYLDGKDAFEFIFEEVIISHLLREDVKFFECFEKDVILQK